MTNIDKMDTLGRVEYLEKLSNKMEDDELDRAINMVRNCIKKPDVPAGRIEDVIVKLQALSAQFQLGASFYKTFGKNETEAKNRKNIFYSSYDACDKLVDALKYIARAKQQGQRKH